MEVPLFFRCPISMELIQDPVTVSTGVTYERKNIEKWLFVYKKKTCPATMQSLENFDLTPNHTVNRLIASWQDLRSQSPTTSATTTPRPSEYDRLISLLTNIESEPFKVSSLKKLQALIGRDDAVQNDFVKLGGIEVLGHIIFQVLVETNDFAAFRACEEALGVLYLLPLSDEASIKFLLKSEFMKSLTIMIQRGSADARMHSITILKNMAKTDQNCCRFMSDQNTEFFKTLLELISDEISTKASSCALDVLNEIMGASKKNRLKAIESGAVCLLIELLPDSNRQKCERMLYVLKLLCEFPEGRSAFADHGLGVAVVSKKILRISEMATKLAVKILWLVCSFLPTEKILEEMMVFGSVKKIIELVLIDGWSSSSTKRKAMKIIKLHGKSWRQYPCFPCELKDYLRLMHVAQ